MTDLERRALLGDRKAQEECTRRRIALPCPKCGKSVQRFETVASLCCLDPGSEAYDDLRKYFGVVCNTLKGGCGIFACGEKEASVKSALAEWNTRPAPPIGRCVACRHLSLGKNDSEGWCFCKLWGKGVDLNDFCSYFEPKGGEENGRTTVD